MNRVRIIPKKKNHHKTNNDNESTTPQIKNERLQCKISQEPDLIQSLDQYNKKKSLFTAATNNQQQQQQNGQITNGNENNSKNMNLLLLENDKNNKDFIKKSTIIDKDLLKNNHKIKRNPNNDDDVDNDDNINVDETKNFIINIKIDLVSLLLFILAFCTRIYRIATPNNVVFDELHYGKYVSLYMKNTFFFDQHPPLGKQLIAGLAHLAGYNGNYTFTRIGNEYTSNVPIFWLRFIPALCGSLLTPTIYELLLEMKMNRWIALLGGVLVILDNALLTQSRFVLMESMLLLFSIVGLLFLIRFQKTKFCTLKWVFYGCISASFFTFAISVKYVGFYSGCLAFLLMCKFIWDLLYDKTISDFQIIFETITRSLIFTIIPIGIYLTIFYIHLSILYKAGPHDSIMTSAFQASLDGGLASITKGQPLKVVHGSQITLRHTHGRTCWLHSHTHLYPVRYPDKRGSSHQQQVTCYSFKDVHNWWIIKRPEKGDLVVGDEPDPIEHGDIIQLVHGITSRGLNSHDVAAPITPHCQEVSCYIDYNISMAGHLLWKLDILNRDTEGYVWHAIRSQVRLIHVDTETALRFSGKQLPDWGFNQHEVVSDRVLDQQDTIWNVEEHRYTKTEDQKERERQMLNAEMIPTRRTQLTFWEKFIELQTKMFWHSDEIGSHMYSSEVFEWPLLDKGIAYWVDKNSNGQIHLIGNLVIWYSGTISIFIYCTLLIIYLIRRHRLCYDLPLTEWNRFTSCGQIFLGGYLVHYLPYFFIDRTLFLHNYLPAFIFKLLLLCYVIDHCDYLLMKLFKTTIGTFLYRGCLIIWLIGIGIVYMKFLALSYGIQKLSSDELINLRWKDTWDFILHKDLP